LGLGDLLEHASLGLDADKSERDRGYHVKYDDSLISEVAQIQGCFPPASDIAKSIVDAMSGKRCLGN
jgi:hypothetical protein